MGRRRRLVWIRSKEWLPQGNLLRRHFFGGGGNRIRPSRCVGWLRPQGMTSVRLCPRSAPGLSPARQCFLGGHALARLKAQRYERCRGRSVRTGVFKRPLQEITVCPVTGRGRTGDRAVPKSYPGATSQPTQRDGRIRFRVGCGWRRKR